MIKALYFLPVIVLPILWYFGILDIVREYDHTYIGHFIVCVWFITLVLTYTRRICMNWLDTNSEFCMRMALLATVISIMSIPDVANSIQYVFQAFAATAIGIVAATHMWYLNELDA